MVAKWRVMFLKVAVEDIQMGSGHLQELSMPFK